MRRKRALGRDLTIPPVANPRRRRRCERDAALYLRTYFPHVFFNPFTTTHRSIIDGVAERIQYGGSKAEAAPRGEGKTSIARGLATCAINYGWRDFFVIVGANAIKAGDNLVSIRDEYEQNDLLAADFPEICIPIRALGGANQRAAAQTVDGARTYLKWTGDLIHMPVVAGSAASGRIITSVGIESGNIRGSGAAVYAEIGEILDSAERVDRDATTIFDSVGMAIEDVAAASLVWETWRSANGLAQTS